MAYELIAGTEEDIRNRINGALRIGPVPFAGLAVGGLTLILNTPSVTVTFGGALGALRTAKQIVADIVGQAATVSAQTQRAQPAGDANALQSAISLWRDAGLDIDSAGTANALLGLSTTVDTVSAGSVDPGRIRSFSQGLTEGYYIMVLVDDLGAGGADPIVITDGSGPLTIDTAQLPATLGTKVAASSLSVVLASNQPTLPVSSTQLPAALGQAAAAASLSVVQASGTEWSLAKALTLAVSAVIKASAGTLRALTARIDSTLATGTYYVQLHDTTAVPGGGAAPFQSLMKVQHTSGVDDFIPLDYTELGIRLTTGITITLSTAEATYVAAGAGMLLHGALYK